jgi:phenylacetate-CoA ligase
VGIVSDAKELRMEERQLGRFLFLNEKSDPLTWSQAYQHRMIDELNEYKPVIMEANPSYLARLCRYVSSQNIQVYQPAIIIFTYEYPSQFHYRQIRQVFSSPLASSYGTTETGYVFMQCEHGYFHQNSEYCRVDFEPFKPDHGGPYLGRILVTPFENPWIYMLRFDTGDIGKLKEDGKCVCGRNSGLILSSLEGRKINLTRTCGGRLVTLFELDLALSILAGIIQYQLIQVTPVRYELHLVSFRTDRENLVDEAVNVLQQLYGSQAKITIIFVDDIPPETSGKYLISKALFPIAIENYLDK